ncbi:hypothetical protein CYMTET_5263 [Cymbomonas tetramitiformis]|uniref:Uncharacterized protein n=1 Tax=Cymbomonas tetramitiformis TaxID=36881 RepID=A0AAE0LJ27_9CHLO|nr:hypothetical protein CYMTET_5263 [Cymbomonas tetramitiformis]
MTQHDVTWRGQPVANSPVLMIGMGRLEEDFHQLQSTHELTVGQNKKQHREIINQQNLIADLQRELKFLRRQNLELEQVVSEDKDDALEEKRLLDEERGGLGPPAGSPREKSGEKSEEALPWTLTGMADPKVSWERKERRKLQLAESSQRGSSAGDHSALSTPGTKTRKDPQPLPGKLPGGRPGSRSPTGSYQPPMKGSNTLPQLVDSGTSALPPSAYFSVLQRARTPVRSLPLSSNRLPSSAEPGLPSIASFGGGGCGAQQHSVNSQVGPILWTRYFFPKMAGGGVMNKSNSFYGHFDVCLTKDLEDEQENSKLVTKAPTPENLDNEFTQLYYRESIIEPSQGAGSGEYKAINLKNSEQRPLADFCFTVSTFRPRSNGDFEPLLTLLGGIVRHLLSILDSTVEVAQQSLEASFHAREQMLQAKLKAQLEAIEQDSAKYKKRQDIRVQHAQDSMRDAAAANEAKLAEMQRRLDEAEAAAASAAIAHVQQTVQMQDQANRGNTIAARGNGEGDSDKLREQDDARGGKVRLVTKDADAWGQVRLLVTKDDA